MLRVGGRLDASMETHNKRLQSGSELCSVQSCEWGSVCALAAGLELLLYLPDLHHPKVYHPGLPPCCPFFIQPPPPTPSHSPLPCHLCGGALNIEEPEAAWLAYKGCSLPCLPHSASCSALHSPFTPGSPCPPPPPLFSSPSQSQLLRFLLCTSRSPLRFFTVTPVTLSLQTLLAVFVSQNLPSSPHCTASPPFSPSLSLSRKASIINTHLWLSPKTEPRFRPSFSAFLITRNEREII